MAPSQTAAAEERRGLVRWLRPEFQNPRGKDCAKKAKKADVEEVLDSPAALGLVTRYGAQRTRRWKTVRAVA